MNQTPRRTAVGRSRAGESGPRPAPAARKERQDRQDRQEAEAELAGYIAQMTGELASMASGARFDMIAYFLSLARMEAEMVARRHVIEGLSARD